MAEQRTQRRLAAILASDIVGYSRLMEADEAGTLARVKLLRADLINPKTAEYGGRIVKTTGDGTLVEFPSAVDAVQHAVEVQQELARRNAEFPPEGRVELRIGINLGDIILDEDDIYGDGVNVAARLEGLAEPGGICISGTVHEHVAGKLPLGFDDLGEQTVKNIQRPVHVYRVRVDGVARAPAPAPAAARPVLPDKPSIVVLPFSNMSGDPDQEFFADGMTEDIITELSRFKELFVISRNSAFRFKGQAVDIQQCAKTLGVQYVVEGSVRKGGDRVRITVQLIDAEFDRHIWAERYDRKLEDIFAVQDEVTTAIVGILPGRLRAALHDRATHKPTENMAAYEYVLTGKTLHHRSERNANAEALKMLDHAIALDANFAHAHAWRACVLGQAMTYNWCADRDEHWRQCLSELDIALRLDPNDSDVHRILAAIAVSQGDLEKASYHEDRALNLNPNDDLIVVQQGEIYTWLGRPEEGIEWIRKAMRLNPYHPERYWSHLGRAYFVARKYADTLDCVRRISAPDAMHYALMAAASALAGDEAGARAHAQDVLRRDSDFSVARHLTVMHYRRSEDLAHYREGLLKAGLAE